ncbi:formate dehydrogenase subunit gamma [Loktanella sp. SALINAS62]|uniref:formate dehydrogenase subunit gamma n=1 Tax=Loktanella sp. SALINAS62 TaxID=2706124 RepID=UPI001B8B6EEB|nr:formate dehydrogenase subunit gamma [Loktanella sp. SALINAS62]MBS1300955.1 formate dehydrogenase subunit gamma [Loktanella sp. SALINAS62]
MTDHAGPQKHDAVSHHGRDFKAYRIGAAIVALILALALAWQVFEIFDGDARTVPEVRWGVTTYNGEDIGIQDTASSLLTGTILTDRTTFQAERYQTGPSPEQNRPDYGVVPDTMMTNSPMDDGEKFTESWAIFDDDTGAMLREGQRIIGISSLPYPNAELFERPFARDWRLGIADIATHLGTLAILGMGFILALFLAVRGRVPIAKGRSPRTVKRFTLFERITHWMTSVSFIGLALTGIVLAVGKTLFLPFGEDVLGAVGWISTWGHMMFFPPFALGVVAMAVMWAPGNLPSKIDLNWIRKGGGMLSDEGPHPPAKKFNAGQKAIFWSAVLGGGLMVVTGVTLMFPYVWADLGTLSWAMLIHAIVGLLLISVFIGHVYIGTVGMEGAFWAMWSGRVDRNWAEQHHSIWLERIETHERDGT